MLPPVAVDRFGVINVLNTDKFGALRVLGESRPNVCRRINNTEESSTGSLTSFLQNMQGGKDWQRVDAILSTDGESTMSNNASEGVENEGTSSHLYDPSSQFSAPLCSTIQERTSNSSGAGRLPTMRFCPPPNHNAEGMQRESGLSPNGLTNLSAAGHSSDRRTNSGSFHPSHESRYSESDPPRAAASLPPPTVRSNVGSTALTSADSVDDQKVPTSPFIVAETLTRQSQDSTNSNPASARFSYRFASSGLQASLLERMEQRQREQDDQSHRADPRCGHVISPEDLIWGSVKQYCGMVLDKETKTLLGTAILVIPQDQQLAQQGSPFPKSAWVTCVKVVEGRAEVLIKNSKGAIHVAQLLLTSTALGLALFSVHVWPGTFALAFLRRVSGPSRLPHRLFVDVDRSDRVYVLGYEEPWESESGAVADVRVRPGRIVDAGRNTIVEIDFTTGQLGGSIDFPVGFRGGLVVRADGLLAGVVTGDLLANHRTKIDFCTAFNVYSLLAEL
ncbi:uncharacterized protein [Physcomitrium patens]